MAKHGSVKRPFRRVLMVGAATVSMAAGSVAVTALPAQALTSNVGYACGYWANVSLFSGPYGSQGCAPQTYANATANSLSPSVTLPASGAPTQAIDNDGAIAFYGPATLFSSPYDANDNLGKSGQLYTATSGGGTVTSLARAMAVGPSPFWTKTPTSWQPATDVGFVQASCSASSPTSKSSQVRVRHGVVDTSVGQDGYPTSQVQVPEFPPPNYTVPFTIDNVGDHGVMVFNEVINNADGSITVNGAHMYLQGPIALGDLIIAQVKCGHV